MPDFPPRIARHGDLTESALPQSAPANIPNTGPLSITELQKLPGVPEPLHPLPFSGENSPQNQPRPDAFPIRLLPNIQNSPASDSDSPRSPA